jgi:hypothetical protein
MAKLKGKKMNGGKIVKSANQLYSNHQISITFDTISREKDNILAHLEKYTPPQFMHKIFVERVSAKTFRNKDRMKYTISFEIEEGLDWFKSYLSSQGIIPNSS